MADTGSKPLVCFTPNDAWGITPPGGSRKIRFKAPEGFNIGTQYEFMQLPCGQCTGCRLEYSRQWAIRCVHEASLYDENSFVTLTYDPEHLPPGGSLRKRDLSLFLKRLRHHHGPFRFYACGEYGEKLGRPHYHICFFGYDPPEQRFYKKSRENPLYISDPLTKIWGQGMVTVGALTFQSAAYAARYIMKKVNGSQKDTHYMNVDCQTGEIISDLVPEFTDMSRGGKTGQGGIGKKWFDEFHGSDVKPDDFVVLKGSNAKMRPPRYYDKLLKDMDPDGYDIIRRERVRNAEKHANNNTPDRLAVREKVQDAKLHLLKRNMDTEQ